MSLPKRLPGTQLTRLFADILANATEDCLCHKRAAQMDIMGPRWCRDNLEYITDWLEEECDDRKLYENEKVKERMRIFGERLARKRRWLPEFLAKYAVNRGVELSLKPGESRRAIIKRVVMVCIRRAEKRKPFAQIQR